MLQRAIHGIQILILLAIITQGLTFVLTGTQPARFVSLVYTVLGAGIVYALLAGVDRWVV
jgi:hypothetical protein